MYSKALKAMVVATLAAAPFTAQAWDTAPGEQKGDFLFRVGISQINPESDNLKPVGGALGIPVSTLVVDSDVSATFDVTWMFHNNFGVELLAAYPFTHGIDAKPYAGGRVRVGYTDVLPPTLSLVWRPFDDKATLQPYVGVGGNWTMFSGESVRGDTGFLPARTKLSLDDSFGVAGVVGLDFFPGEAKKWFANAQVRYIQIETDAELQIPAGSGLTRVKVGTVDINPFVYGVHIGRRFGAPAPAPVAAAAPPPPPPPPPPALPKTATGFGDIALGALLALAAGLALRRFTA